MSQPLGTEVGNANEIAESIGVLRGEVGGDVLELTLALGEVMLELAGIEGGRDLLESKISSGEALQKFVEVTMAHGGDPAYVEDPSLLPRAPLEAVVTAPRSGHVTRCDALAIGVAATRLGAGRERKEDLVDPGVSISVAAKVGTWVDGGDPLAVVRYSDPSRWEAQQDGLAKAWSIEDEAADLPAQVLERIEI
jgi:thymidine phosphorylase